MNKLLTTKAYGDPDCWPKGAAILAETVWEIAHVTHNESPLTMDMGKMDGCEVSGSWVIESCANLTGNAFVQSIRFLLSNGILSTPEVFDFGTLVLTSRFIQAQQAASQQRALQTDRLVTLLLKTHVRYRSQIARLGLAQTYEKELKIRKSIAVCMRQVNYLSRLSEKGRRNGTLDSAQWTKRIENALLQMQDESGRVYA